MCQLYTQLRSIDTKIINIVTDMFNKHERRFRKSDKMVVFSTQRSFFRL